MATEGESPIVGAVLIGAAGFLFCLAITLGILATGLLGSGLLWLCALACLLGAGGAAWYGWQEVAEATRFRRKQDAHRVTMIRAKL